MECIAVLLSLEGLEDAAAVTEVYSEHRTGLLLIVDDDQQNRTLLAARLEAGTSARWLKTDGKR
jgi:hypothetical protein